MFRKKSLLANLPQEGQEGICVPQKLMSVLRVSSPLLLFFLVLNVQATPISLVNDSVFEVDDYLVDFERINTDVDGNVFNGFTEDLRDRQWLRTEFYDDFRLTLDSSVEETSSPYKPNSLGTYRGGTATTYPRDVFNSWASMGFFGPGVSNYDPSTGEWGYGALSNFNTTDQNGGWIDLVFDNPVTRLGFNYVNAQDLKIEVNGQVLSFTGGMPWDLSRFAGILDLDGFEHVRVYSYGGGAFLIDNLRWEGGTIPEPTTVAMLGMGAAAIFAKRKSLTPHRKV